MALSSGKLGSYRKFQIIQNGEIFQKLLKRQKQPVNRVKMRFLTTLLKLTKWQIIGYRSSKYTRYSIVEICLLSYRYEWRQSKKVIGLVQSYFAIKTREQELLNNFNTITEDEKRVSICNDLKEHNKSLVDAANQDGVTTNKEYATFQNYGYKGLYGGLDAKAIHKRKGLKKS